jgi:hypothetical protein
MFSIIPVVQHTVLFSYAISTDPLNATYYMAFLQNLLIILPYETNTWYAVGCFSLFLTNARGLVNVTAWE